MSSAATPSWTDAHEWFERVARTGWLAKGFVFFVIGVLAIRLASTSWSDSSSDVNQNGAMQVVAAQPFGAALLIAISLGLFVFMLWNLAQAAMPGSTDFDPLGIVKRIGWGGLGLFYGYLGYRGLRLALREVDEPASGRQDADGSSSGSGNTTEQATRQLLDLPGGRWIVVVVAIGVVAVAGFHLWKGLTHDFVDDIDTDDVPEHRERWLGRIGAIGFVARAFVLFAVAWFLLRAAITFDADDAVGLDGALREVANVPYGRVLLVAIGIGLAVAGGYDMATFRRQRLA